MQNISILNKFIFLVGTYNNYTLYYITKSNER